MQSQNFNIIATYAVDGDVVFVGDQFSGAWNTTSPNHTRTGLEFAHGAQQLLHKAGRSGRVVFCDEAYNFINHLTWLQQS